MHLNSLRELVPVKQIMLVIGSQCVHKQTLDFSIPTKTFSNATSFKLFNKYCKGSAIQVVTVFLSI